MTSLRDLGALSGLLVGISFIAGVAGAMALADFPYPRPGSEPAEIRRYFSESSGAARLSAAGQLIPFTASVAQLAALSDLGRQGLEAAVIAGGGLAATTHGPEVASDAALTGRWRKQDASAVALHRQAFAAAARCTALASGAGRLPRACRAAHRRAASTLPQPYRQGCRPHRRQGHWGREGSLAKGSAKVKVNGRDRKAMDAVIEEICGNEGEALGVAADVTDQRSTDGGTANCGGKQRNYPNERRQSK